MPLEPLLNPHRKTFANSKEDDVMIEQRLEKKALESPRKKAENRDPQTRGSWVSDRADSHSRLAGFGFLRLPKAKVGSRFRVPEFQAEAFEMDKCCWTL